MAETHSAPLKREPLLEEELPATNPTVRLRHRRQASDMDYGLLKH
jgi:hypothetical protein